ncbi:NAD(P)-binding protein [Leucogyrophana mollusca]|uniref:NAD(P)-binding protein n=1 Tax=Leucogyrophana mollusca TaxID=85980 RepID=A0ACB8B1E0_9AGAM|nr:NAD(P)-binding protein [Leucogyrophana mollusca]
MSLLALLCIPIALFLLCFYFWHVNRGITKVPSSALAFSPLRFTVAGIEEAAGRLASKPFDAVPHLPPATGRRYVVIGGSGFLGGWIVLHLLMRGEDPRNIRIIDIRRPIRKDMLSGKAAQVPFVAADVRDADSLRAAFAVDWPSNSERSDKGITVFHTAASIRFYERHESLVPRSFAVNVDGTRNSLTVSREYGVDLFVFTSSASIPVRRTRHWIWPWQRHAETLVQIVNDTISNVPRKHNDFFSNYAYTKSLAEELVRGSDSPGEGFRTGCLRPGNAIFGPGGDLVAGPYLARGTNPSWTAPIIQSFTYVENASYAHLLYEQRLLESRTRADSLYPDIGGQAFCITDQGNAISYGDLYLTLSTLTKGKTRFPLLPPAPFLLLARILELYYIAQTRLPRVLPPLTGDILELQPSVFNLATIHMKVDDSRARLPPQEGGLGYNPPWTTLEGLCQVVNDYLKDAKELQEHQSPANGQSVESLSAEDNKPSDIVHLSPPQAFSGLKHR